ncbi:MAG: hypothetical protein KatS3mg036_0318 [Ignavibacterium sp.]|nr:MAG: hypothetical protein KatS3mg036_0318 [Ignavibacterium sp.]
MKTLLLTLTILITTSITAMSQNIEEIIGQVKSKFAPDKRTAIFDISYIQEGDELILKGEVSEKIFKDELLKELKSKTNFKIIDDIDFLPSSKIGPRIFGIVNLSVCNIRSKPDHPEELSTQALMGTPVRILKEKDGWFLIQTPDEYLGWVDEDGFARKTAEEMIDWINSNKIIYTKWFGFIIPTKILMKKLAMWLQEIF